MTQENDRDWPLVSVVFVTYRRAHLLERTLYAFREKTDYPALEFVVADDGSPWAVQAVIKKLPFNRFALSPKNQGLGANLNAGLRATSGAYVLVLEDDWLCQGPNVYLKQAVALLEADPNAGMVRFYGYDMEFASDEPVRLPVSGAYSNTPHLRKKASLAEVGLYQEGVWMEACETEYVNRFSARASLDTYVLPMSFNKTFQHIGEAESHRTRSLRVRFRNWVSVAVSPIKRNFPQVFNVVRAAIGRNR